MLGCLSAVFVNIIRAKTWKFRKYQENVQRENKIILYFKRSFCPRRPYSAVAWSSSSGWKASADKTTVSGNALRLVGHGNVGFTLAMMSTCRRDQAAVVANNKSFRERKRESVLDKGRISLSLIVPTDSETRRIVWLTTDDDCGQIAAVVTRIEERRSERRRKRKRPFDR